MKKSVLAFASASMLLLAAANLSAETASNQIATAESGDATMNAAAENKNKGANPSSAKERKPFTPEDLKKAQANKKKLEWWQMPKPPVFQSHSRRGGGHGGH